MLILNYLAAASAVIRVFGTIGNNRKMICAFFSKFQWMSPLPICNCFFCTLQSPWGVDDEWWLKPTFIFLLNNWKEELVVIILSPCCLGTERVLQRKRTLWSRPKNVTKNLTHSRYSAIFTDQSCLATIRKPSFCSRWRQLQKLTARETFWRERERQSDRDREGQR